MPMRAQLQGCKLSRFLEDNEKLELEEGVPSVGGP